MTPVSPRTALITGASRGLGLALAQALAGNGWRLIVDARGPERWRTQSRHLRARPTLPASPGMWPILRIAASWRRLLPRQAGGAAVVNNAGTLGVSPPPPLLDYPLDALLEVFRVNVVAQLGVLQAVRRRVEARRGCGEHQQRCRR